MSTVYNEDFSKKQVQPVVRERTNSYVVGIPFVGINSYAVQYPNKASQPPAVIKPVDQMQLIPVKLEGISQYKREFHRKEASRDEFSNFSKMMNKRLHINSKDKLVFVNSSYQETYKPKGNA